jgi:glutamine amidotransferase
MLTIIDTGIANVGSFKYKLFNLGIESHVATSLNDIEQATKFILPGVGHFKSGMKSIHEKGIVESLNKKVLEDKVPIIGICLGMQLLTNESEEGDVVGLGWIDAETKRLNFNEHKKSNFKIPHVGWSQVSKRKDTVLFIGVPDDHKFYFTHSYFVHCNDESNIIATTEYGLEFCSIVQKDNIYGTQFHPEKSHATGFNVLINFIKYA